MSRTAEPLCAKVYTFKNISNLPAQADEPTLPIKTLSDEFACPGMHTERLDEKTVQCLKVNQ